MSDNVIELTIEPLFERLTVQVSDEYFKVLEEDMLLKGCIEPICVWKNVLVDGHNRYKICKKHNIPFSIAVMMFRSKSEAISWICANQLKKNNMTEELFRYLIGKRYHSEKIYEAPNSTENNQYPNPEGDENTIRSKTAIRLGEEYHVSHSTVCKYSIYTNAIDILFRKSPDIAKLTLIGKLRISQENIIELSKLPEETIFKLKDKIIKSDGDFMKHYFTKKDSQNRSEYGYDISGITKTSIKDMPKYDPDAEFESLALTVPSWISFIKRVHDTADIRETTFNAKFKLTSALVELIKAAKDMIKRLEEE